jgi:hypothetical protein
VSGSKSKAITDQSFPAINNPHGMGGKSPFSKPGSKGNLYNSSGDESFGDKKGGDLDDEDENGFGSSTRPIFSQYSKKNMQRNNTYAHSLVKGNEKLYKRGIAA